MSQLRSAIDTAETEGRRALGELVADLADLAERAKVVRTECRRITSLTEDADRIERAIRMAVQGTGRPGIRPPDEANGEAVDSDHVDRVLAARAG